MKNETLFELLDEVDDDLVTAAHTPGKEKSTVIKKRKTVKIVLAAAAILLLFTLSAGAAYRFFVPKDLENVMSFTSDRLLTIIDEGNADEVTVKVENKAIDTAGFHVVFEAIVQGKAMKPSVTVRFANTQNDENGSHTLGVTFTAGGEVITEDKTYAIFTVTRIAGGPVIYNRDYNEDVTPASVGYIMQLKGYIPNPNCFSQNLYLYEDTDTNVLYLACDITPALPFGGREMKIGVIGRYAVNMDVVDMDDNGLMCNKEGFTGISAIFDLPLDASYADEAAAAEMIKSDTFITREEYESILEDLQKEETEKSAPAEDADEATKTEQP